MFYISMSVRIEFQVPHYYDKTFYNTEQKQTHIQCSTTENYKWSDFISNISLLTYYSKIIIEFKVKVNIIIIFYTFWSVAGLAISCLSISCSRCLASSLFFSSFSLCTFSLCALLYRLEK
jgi:hypothetical protein